MVSQPHDLRAALLALEGVITGGVQKAANAITLKDYAVLVSADERAAGSFD
jgi:hypothetical protein